MSALSNRFPLITKNPAFSRTGSLQLAITLQSELRFPFRVSPSVFPDAVITSVCNLFSMANSPITAGTPPAR